MIPKIKRLSQPILALAILAILASLFVASQVGANPLRSDNANPLVLSGTLEARQTRIASEVSARVINVHADKGDTVKAGDPLIELDDSTMRSSLKEAESGVRTAQAELDKVQEKARPGNIALAQANVAQAQADLEAAKRALDNANRVLASPQDLTTQLHAWEGRAAAAQGMVGQAQAGLGSVQDQLVIAERDQSVSGKAKYGALLKQQAGAEATLKAAQADQAGSQRIVDLYHAAIQNPLELQAAQHSAANDVQLAQASLSIAQAELQIVTRVPQAEAVALANARFSAAQANLHLLQAQAKRYTLASPLDGTILDRSVEPGETAPLAKALLTIADTRELEMTLYAPIRNLPSVRVGQSVSIRVPSLPSTGLAGKVTYIAQEAEFKPANIYNSQERSEMVFAVKVSVHNDGRLKAGLPADAVFQ